MTSDWESLLKTHFNYQINPALDFASEGTPDEMIAACDVGIHNWTVRLLLAPDVEVSVFSRPWKTCEEARKYWERKRDEQR